MSRLPELRVLTDWPAFEAVTADWAALHARAGGALYSSHHWLAAIRAAFGLPGAMAFVTLWQGGRMVAAAPMVAAPERLSKLAPLYRPPVLRLMACKYSGFVEMLAETDALRARLAEAVHDVAAGRVIALDPLKAGAATDQILTVLGECGRIITQVPHFHSVTIPARRTSAEHLARRTAGFRKGLRKAQRRLEAAGGRFEELRHLDPAMMARIEAISARSWKSTAGTSLAADPGNARFLAEIGSRLAPDGIILSIEGVDRAFAASIRYAMTDYMIWTEFDESVADLSPGRLVVWELICCVLDRRDDRAVQDLVRRTHFTGEMAEEGYALLAARAAPRRGIAHLLGTAEAGLRLLAGHRHFGHRKGKRRADVNPQGIEP